MPSANTTAPGSPPRLRTIETPSGTKRDVATDWLTFQPRSAPGRYGFVPSPSESPTANTARSRITSLSRSTARPFTNQASLYLPAPSMSNRVREIEPGLCVWRSRQCWRSPALRKQNRYWTRPLSKARSTATGWWPSKQNRAACLPPDPHEA